MPNANQNVNKPNKKIKIMREATATVRKGKIYQSKPSQLLEQSAQKGGTCWYYIMNYLRERYGKGFDDTHLGRQIEIIISNWRKEQTKLSACNTLFKHHELARQLNVSEEHIQERFKCHKLAKWLPDYQKLYAEFIEGQKRLASGKLTDKASRFFKKLANRWTVKPVEYFEYETFEKFIRSKEHYAMKQTFVELEAVPHVGNYSFPTTENPCLNLINLSAFKYGLQASNWSPDQGIEGLMDEIEKNGALFFYGDFGRGYYSKTRQMLGETVDGREVYGWPSNSYCRWKTKELPFHAILVLKVSNQNGIRSVYYLDPMDGSNDNIIYKIPYERFLQAVQITIDSSNSSPPKYAYHAPKKENVTGDNVVDENVIDEVRERSASKLCRLGMFAATATATAFAIGTSVSLGMNENIKNSYPV